MSEFTPEEIAHIRDDFYAYCQHNLKIVNVYNELVPLVPNTEQRQLIDHVISCLAESKPIRVIILKSRKIGFSTIIEAMMYWWTATHQNINSKVIAHDLESSQTIYKMFQRFYDNSHPFFQPSKKYYTKRDLTFDNEDGTGLKSSMSIATADNPNVGRGDTISWLHASEVAFWGDGGKIAAGLMEAVPLVPNTAIFLESTANGLGGYFYEEWQAAERGESLYTPFFFPWYEHDKYSQKTTNLKPTAEEQEWMRRYNLTKGQISWYRMKKKSFNHNKELMKQEYPFTPQESFLVSGRPRFDMETLQLMELRAKEPEYYELYEKGDNVVAEKAQFSNLKVWKKPMEGHKYTIGADVSEGLENGDFSVAEVMDKDTMETVARWRGHIEPAEFGDLIEMLARWYNQALVGVEVNNHGLTVVQRLRDRRYPNMYRREKGFDERLESPTAKLGWRTDQKTKYLMINALAEAINEKKIKDYDIVFIKECMTYVIDSRGRTNAQQGEFDDTVIAKAINLQMFEWTDVSQYRQNVKTKFPSKYKKAKDKNRKLVKKR